MDFRNILITGGAGFIGSHVTNYLVNKYKNIMFVVLDKLDYCGSKKNINESFGKNNFVFIHGDILNYELINHLFELYKFDAILHFAAQTHVDNSFGNSLEFTKTNVLGTHTLLECSKLYKIKRFIHVSTDEVYGEVVQNAAVENTILNPNNPYACSKAGAEFMCQAYKRSFNLPIIITRGNNVFGIKQYPEKVIPKFVFQLIDDKPITIHGDGNVKRNFIYTKDVVSAFDLILFKGVIGEIYNIGSDVELTIKELAIKMQDIYNTLTNSNRDNIIYTTDRAFNDSRYLISSNKLQELGWKTNNDFHCLLMKTMEWYITNNDWFTNHYKY